MGEISLAHNEAENLLALRRLESRFSSRYRRLPQTPADMLSHLWIPIPRSPIGREALLHGHSSREYPPDGHFHCIMAEALSSTSEA